MAEYWLVAHKCGHRRFFVLITQKNTNFQEVNGEIQSLTLCYLSCTTVHVLHNNDNFVTLLFLHSSSLYFLSLLFLFLPPLSLPPPSLYFFPPSLNLSLLSPFFPPSTLSLYFHPLPSTLSSFTEEVRRIKLCQKEFCNIYFLD